jgi:hypothetical protein
MIVAESRTITALRAANSSTPVTVSLFSIIETSLKANCKSLIRVMCRLGQKMLSNCISFKRNFSESV